MTDIIFLVLGAIIGALIIFFYSKARNLALSKNYVARTDYDKITSDLSALTVEKSTLTERARLLSEQLAKANEDMAILRDELSDLQKEYSVKATELVQLEKRMAEYKTEIEDLQTRFRAEFQNLANTILEEKSQKFTEQNKTNLDGILKPLGEKIEDFRKKVEDVYFNESKERYSLKNEIKGLMEMNNRLSEEAVNLTNALTGDNKKMGDWGELILEGILEKTGLIENTHYFIQKTYANEAGESIRPDIIVKLPGNKAIVIDSKVSLVAFQRYTASDSKEDKDKYLKEHIRSIKTHIDGLSRKVYQNIGEHVSLDFVMMFLPVEPAFLEAIKYDGDLWLYAYNKKILLISPTNVFAVLKMAHSLWQQDSQSKNAIDIAQKSGDLYDKFVGLTNDLIELGKRLNLAQNFYKDSMNKLREGPGNLIKRVEDIKALGAKATKSIDKLWLQEGQDHP